MGVRCTGCGLVSGGVDNHAVFNAHSCAEERRKRGGPRRCWFHVWVFVATVRVQRIREDGRALCMGSYEEVCADCPAERLSKSSDGWKLCQQEECARGAYFPLALYPTKRPLFRHIPESEVA